MSKNKDFRKVKPEDNIFGSKILELQDEKKVEADKRQKIITTTLGNEFRIERWSHGDCFDRLPTVANLLYVPTAVVIEEMKAEADGILYNDIDVSITPNMLFQRMQEIGFTDWLADCLDQTYVLGEDTPVDFENSFVSTSELLEVVVAVLQANFMMDLCVNMHHMAPILLSTGKLQESLTKASQPTSTKQSS